MPFSDANALIVRLVVLYEDLRIESLGIVEKEIACLDQLEDKYSRHYFVRRSILTLVEMAHTFRLLDKDPDFQAIKSNFDRKSSIQWQRAVSFFSRYEKILKDVRNDIGGHFGYDAARDALQNMPYDTVGKMEIKKARNNKVNLKLLFAGEIAASAFSKRRDGQPPLEFACYLIRVAELGYKLSTKAIQIISYNYLWKRFGG